MMSIDQVNRQFFVNNSLAPMMKCASDQIVSVAYEVDPYGIDYVMVNGVRPYRVFGCSNAVVAALVVQGEFGGLL